MATLDTAWRRFPATTIAGSFLGAVLTFFYFRFVDPEVAAAAGRVGLWEIAFSVAAFAALAALGYSFASR